MATQHGSESLDAKHLEVRGMRARLPDSNILYGANRHFRGTVLRQPMVIGNLAGVTSADCDEGFTENYLDWIERFESRIAVPELGQMKLELQGSDGVSLELLAFQAMLTLDLSMREKMRRYAPLEYAEILRQEDGIVFVWDTSEPGISRRAGLAALAGFGDLLPPSLRRLWPHDDRGYSYRLTDVERRADRLRWSATTGVLALAAKQRGLPFEPLADTYVRIGQGAKQLTGYASIPHLTGRPARRKSGYVSRLRSAGLPTLCQGSSVSPSAGESRRLCRFLLVGGNVVSVVEALGHGQRASSNVIYCDVTDTIHPEHCEMVANAGRYLGLAAAEINVSMNEVTQPAVRARARIVGITPNPNLERHAFPDRGAARDIAGAVMDVIVPHERSVTLPQAIVFGSRGTGRTAADLDALLRSEGHAVGLATPSRTSIAGHPVESGSLGVRGAVRYLANDPRVEIMVSVSSPKKIERHGLILDRCTTAAVLPRAPNDDPGAYQRGVDVILQAATGAIVVDADSDDPFEFANRAGPEKFILITSGSGNELTRRHAAVGGRSLLVTGANGSRHLVLTYAGRPEATFAFSSMWKRPEAKIEGDVKRRLNAIGLAVGLGVPARKIEEALTRRAYQRS